MTEAAEKLLFAFEALPRREQKEVLVSLLRLPIEARYTAPTDEQLRRAADAVFMEMDRSEAHA